MRNSYFLFGIVWSLKAPTIMTVVFGANDEIAFKRWNPWQTKVVKSSKRDDPWIARSRRLVLRERGRTFIITLRSRGISQFNFYCDFQSYYMTYIRKLLNMSNGLRKKFPRFMDMLWPCKDNKISNISKSLVSVAQNIWIH